MKKYLVLTILSLCLGYLMARFIFRIYDSDQTLAMSSNVSKYYFISVGEYGNLDDMQSSNTKLGKYIYINEDNIYYVYTCITKDNKLISKIEEYYSELGYSVGVKEYVLSDNDLNDTILGTDMLLKESNEIKEICRQSLLKYKEG